jgi:SAM-dependent methyltransferase
MDPVARKRLGAFYTPPALVARALDSLGHPAPGARVLDLACGEGVWLAAAAARWQGLRLHGVDLDRRAVEAAACAIPEASWTVGDALRYPLEQADLILGNPPWGAGRGRHVRRGAESASAFVERALDLLRPGGRLCLLLPVALLEVAAHRALREQLLARAAIERVEPTGNFPGVFAPAALLVARLEPDPAARLAQAVWTPRGEVAQAELLRDPDRALLSQLTGEERSLIDALETSSQRLAGRATFILGVVTGGNRRALADRGEPIVAGPDVEPYAIRAPSRRLALPLDRVQQAAPRAAYARRKIVYRFIAPRPVAALDEEGRLTLNSANALAVDDPALDPQFVVAALNSTPIGFVHAARSSLPRVLRRHLERLPLPRASRAEQRAIARLVDDEADAEELDVRISALYNLTRSQMTLLRKCHRS